MPSRDNSKLHPKSSGDPVATICMPIGERGTSNVTTLPGPVDVAAFKEVAINGITSSPF
jgi:hypothetical protein